MDILLLRGKLWIGIEEAALYFEAFVERDVGILVDLPDCLAFRSEISTSSVCAGVSARIHV